MCMYVYIYIDKRYIYVCTNIHICVGDQFVCMCVLMCVKIYVQSMYIYVCVCLFVHINNVDLYVYMNICTNQNIEICQYMIFW